jgi:pilus assembly protein Flp/PilA
VAGASCSGKLRPEAPATRNLNLNSQQGHTKEATRGPSRLSSRLIEHPKSNCTLEMARYVFIGDRRAQFSGQGLGGSLHNSYRVDGAPMKAMWSFLQSEDGPTAVEYAVMLAMILIVCIGAITLVGGETVNYWSNNQQQLEKTLP